MNQALIPSHIRSQDKYLDVQNDIFVDAEHGLYVYFDAPEVSRYCMLPVPWNGPLSLAEEKKVIIAAGFAREEDSFYNKFQPTKLTAATAHDCGRAWYEKALELPPKLLEEYTREQVKNSFKWNDYDLNSDEITVISKVLDNQPLYESERETLMKVEYLHLGSITSVWHLWFGNYDNALYNLVVNSSLEEISSLVMNLFEFRSRYRPDTHARL